MKYIFWLVLFSNIMFFTWHAVTEEKRSEPPVPVRAEATGENSLLLVREREGVSVEDKPVPPPRPALVSLSTGECYALGPFLSANEADEALRLLKKLDIQGRTREAEQKIPKGYWVYLPASKTREEAKEKLRQMHRSNVDSFLVTKGLKKNAISVGIYNDHGHAQLRLEELQRKGFDVVMEERFSTKTQHWADLGKNAALATGELTSRLAAEFPAQRLGKRECQ